MLNVADIISEAEKRTGIADPEPVFRPNLEHLVAALKTDNTLTALGAATARKVLIDRTADRLEGLKWLRDFPEIGEEVVSEPVFLTGLPRSGTTYFQYLFDRDQRPRHGDGRGACGDRYRLAGRNTDGGGRLAPRQSQGRTRRQSLPSRTVRPRRARSGRTVRRVHALFRHPARASGSRSWQELRLPAGGAHTIFLISALLFKAEIARPLPSAGSWSPSHRRTPCLHASCDLHRLCGGSAPCSGCRSPHPPR